MIAGLNDMVPGLYDVIPGLDHVVVACLDHVVSRLDHVISSLNDVTHDDGLPYGDDAHVRVHGKLCPVLLENSQLGCAGAASSLFESECLSWLQRGLLGRSSRGGLDLGWPIAVNIAEVLFQRVLVGRLETAIGYDQWSLLFKGLLEQCKTTSDCVLY